MGNKASTPSKANNALVIINPRSTDEPTTTLVADVAGVVAEFFGTSQDASSLALTSKSWNDAVRCSPAYERLYLTIYCGNPGVDSGSINPPVAKWSYEDDIQEDRRRRCCPFRCPLSSAEHEEHQSEVGDYLIDDWRRAASQIIQVKFGTVDKATWQQGQHRKRSDPTPETTTSFSAKKKDSSWFSSLKKKFKLGSAETTVVMLGLSDSGKTTMLYKLHTAHDQNNEPITTIPTVGFNIETVEFEGKRSPLFRSKDCSKSPQEGVSQHEGSKRTGNQKQVKVTMWDVGGQPKLRPLWRHYVLNKRPLPTIIFCLSATTPIDDTSVLKANPHTDVDDHSVQCAKKELHKIYNLLDDDEERPSSTLLPPLLVFVTKMDHPEAHITVSQAIKLLALDDLPAGVADWCVQGCTVMGREEHELRGVREGITWAHEAAALCS